MVPQPMPPPRPASGSPRLQYIDWLRGFAVLLMILWHAMDAWMAPEARGGAAFGVVVFLGGWAAPLFLFLAGVSVSLAGRKALARYDRRAAGWRLQKRGWQIFGLAHLFRLQSFLLNPSASWSSLLKPDILNVLGLGLVATSFCWSRAPGRARQVLWLLVPAAAVVLLTPASREWIWPAAVLRPISPRFQAYIQPVPGLGVFTIFPSLAFVFAGAFVGARIADEASQSGLGLAGRTDGGGARLQAGLAAAGAGLCLAGGVGARLPAVVPSQFWTTSSSWFLIRVGIMTLGFPLAWAWLRFGTRRAASARSPQAAPMLLFGRVSLFVYWVHVELAYGVFSYPMHQALPLGWALIAFMGLTTVMYGVARLWERRRRPLVPAYLRAGRPSALLAAPR